MKVVLASQNKHKISELQELMKKYVPEIQVLSMADIGFDGEIVEDGETFEENAYIKARALADMGYIGVGDDSGLSVRALGGEPGIYSARYAGTHGDDAANNALLLKNLADKTDRHAEFVCAVSCVFPDELEHSYCFVGRTEGRIIDEYRGEGGFGYDPLFYYEPLEKTFAELSREEKNSISHRGKAIAKFARDFADIAKGRDKK